MSDQDHSSQTININPDDSSKNFKRWQKIWTQAFSQGLRVALVLIIATVILTVFMYLVILGILSLIPQFRDVFGNGTIKNGIELFIGSGNATILSAAIAYISIGRSLECWSRR